MSNLIQFIQVVLAHPNHPRIIHFPIALSYLGVLVVLLAWWRRDSFFERVAFYTMLLLPLSTIPAGLTGMLENQTLYAGNAPNTTLKLILAVSLLLISAGAAIWRWRQPDIMNKSPGKYLYLLAFFICAGLTTLLGALGGIIVWGT
jgi:uncharacterized membrane protein